MAFMAFITFEPVKLENILIREHQRPKEISVDITKAVLSGTGYLNKNDFRNQAWHYLIKRKFLFTSLK